MKKQLTYVLITPYSLLKSRTGGIIGRILALSRNVRFVGARMYAPSDAMIDRYIATLKTEEMFPGIREALRTYADVNMRRDNPFGISNRCLVLLFEGPDAVKSLREDVVGALSVDMRGDSIRGTYGDVVLSRDKVAFFEPAVLMPTTDEANAQQLKILSEFAMADGGILTELIRYPQGAQVETTLVIIKPDNFARRSSRPGNIIDVFSRTGLYIVAAKMLRLTRGQAEEFYGPLRKIFVRKLAGQAGARAAKALAGEFGFAITEEMKEKFADALKEANAEFEFGKIVNYMTGQDESGAELPAEERGKCVALLYQGENAIEKIRHRLGGTNPKEAAEGTIRSIYGYDLMRNGAHASDSAASAERERKIVGLWREEGSCEFWETIERYLGGKVSG